MQPEIHSFPEADKTDLIALYRAHIGEIIPDLALPPATRLDRYWSDPTQHAFRLSLAGQLIGFALISEDDHEAMELAEFYIAKPWRRKGLGTRAAHLLFAQFPGRWTLGVASRTEPGQAFWAACLASLSLACEIRPGPAKTPHQCGSFDFVIRSPRK